MATKKKISKEELRRAMLEAKKKHSTIKKIESPLARYNELDQLTCVICKTVVRNEAIWPVHLNSKAHKDNVELARKAKLKLSTPPQPQVSNKRPSTFAEPQETKKVKSILKNAPPPPPPPPASPTNTKSSLPSDFFDNSTIAISPLKLPKLNITNGINGNTVSDNSEEKLTDGKDNKDAKDKDGGQSTLPEGFFDDPIMDAKARHVEYKDPIEEEWERFQSEIKEETAQSEQIIGDDQEEAATERQLDVIEEQLRNWNRVMDLVKQKELVQTTEKKQDNSSSSSDEEDFDEFLDWRAKKSYHE